MREKECMNTILLKLNSKKCRGNIFSLIKNFLNDWLPINFKPVSSSGEDNLLYFIIRLIGEIKIGKLRTKFAKVNKIVKSAKNEEISSYLDL